MQSRHCTLWRAIAFILLIMAIAVPAFAAEFAVELLVQADGVPLARQPLTIFTSAEEIAVVTDEDGVARFTIVEDQFRAQVGERLTGILHVVQDGTTVLEINTQQ